MPYQLNHFADVGLNESLLQFLIDEHEESAIPEYDRLWSYYRNPSEPVEVNDGRGRRTVWRPAQVRGLPTRLTRSLNGSAPKEIVIENDIAWRIETLVNYVSGGDVRFISRAGEPEMRSGIEQFASTLFETNGGHQFMADLSLLASIYGQVDLILRSEQIFSLKNKRGILNSQSDQGASEDTAPSQTQFNQSLCKLAEMLKVEMIEAPRAIPFLDPNDYRRILAYIIYYRRFTSGIDEPNFLQRTVRKTGLFKNVPLRQRETATVVEIISAGHRQRYEDEQLIFDGVNPSGMLPVVHIQNLSQPFFYEGVGDVEPLIQLQDELNTRLSDRANRVTLQSFKMYLGKNVDGFGERPIGPGQMWITDNPDAVIQEFGGDSSNPSEDQHIEDLRAALDKASSVSPLAAGLIRTKVGTLSSENALRISLLGILAKTDRKRQAIGRGLKEILRMSLGVLNQAGLFITDPEDRECDVVWETPLPADETRQLENALIKRDLGIPRERILAELGYDDRS